MAPSPPPALTRALPSFVGIALFVSSTVAHAGDPAGAPPGETLRRAERECAELEYELCAESAMAVAVDDAATVEERTRARFIAGSAQRVMGKDVDARLTFRALLLEAPEFTPPVETPAKVSQFFILVQTEVADERARSTANANAPPVTSLVVESVPTGASVTVDGAVRGTTPLRLDDVEVGLREVRVTSSDGVDVVTVPVDVAAGGPTSVRVRFRQLEEVETPPLNDEEAEKETPATWSGAATKAALGLGALAGGCVLGCTSFIVIVIVVNAISAVDLGILAYGACLGCWTAGLLVGGGLLAWSGVDVVETVEASSQRLIHMVAIVPPSGAGEEKTLTFPVDETAY